MIGKKKNRNQRRSPSAISAFGDFGKIDPRMQEILAGIFPGQEQSKGPHHFPKQEFNFNSEAESPGKEILFLRIWLFRSLRLFWADQRNLWETKKKINRESPRIHLHSWARINPEHLCDVDLLRWMDNVFLGRFHCEIWTSVFRASHKIIAWTLEELGEKKVIEHIGQGNQAVNRSIIGFELESLRINPMIMQGGDWFEAWPWLTGGKNNTSG